MGNGIDAMGIGRILAGGGEVGDLKDAVTQPFYNGQNAMQGNGGMMYTQDMVQQPDGTYQNRNQMA